MKMLAPELSPATVFWSQIEKKSPNATLAKPSATPDQFLLDIATCPTDLGNDWWLFLVHYKTKSLLYSGNINIIPALPFTYIKNNSHCFLYPLNRQTVLSCFCVRCRFLPKHSKILEKNPYMIFSTIQ